MEKTGKNRGILFAAGLVFGAALLLWTARGPAEELSSTTMRNL